jgi:hypothetical protein
MARITMVKILFRSLSAVVEKLPVPTRLFLRGIVD